MARHHLPCRECGAVHNNPMSSSLCPDCGIALHEARQKQQDEEPTVEQMLDCCDDIDELKAFIRGYLI